MLRPIVGAMVIEPKEQTPCQCDQDCACGNSADLIHGGVAIALPDSVVELLDGVVEIARKPVPRFALQLLAPSVHERARVRDGEPLGTKILERLKTMRPGLSSVVTGVFASATTAEKSAGKVRTGPGPAEAGGTGRGKAILPRSRGGAVHAAYCPDDREASRLHRCMPGRLTQGERERIAAVACERYAAGESWVQIAEDFNLHPGHVRRLTTERYAVDFRRWGQRPVADPDQVALRRGRGESIQAIASALGCSRTAVRTAIERAGCVPRSRYPRLSARREPTEAEVERISGLYATCPYAPRARPGHRDTAGEHGLLLALACRELVDDGVPMQTLSRALGRGPTWVHWLLGRHDQQPASREARSTSRRTRSIS